MKDLFHILATFWPSLALLCLSAIPAAYMHAHDHGKMKGWGKPSGFFGWNQQSRKYKRDNNGRQLPAFWGSTTFFVALTDAYHASQALMRILMSLSVILAIGAPWRAFLVVWLAYATVHAIFYKLLSK